MLPAWPRGAIAIFRQKMSRKRRSLADEPFLVIRAAASDLAGGQAIAPHAHDWHQLIYASAGVMTVTTEAGSWVVPPNRAIWVPAGIRHAIRFAAQSRFRTLYIMPGWSERVPASCQVVAVSTLLSALVVRAAAHGVLDRRDAIEAAMAALIVDEFRQATVPPFSLPQPESAAPRRAAALIAARARGSERRDAGARGRARRAHAGAPFLRRNRHDARPLAAAPRIAPRAGAGRGR
jgi:quercetin dioxygenase-like cupin family protein